MIKLNDFRNDMKKNLRSYFGSNQMNSSREFNLDIDIESIVYMYCICPSFLRLM